MDKRARISCCLVAVLLAFAVGCEPVADPGVDAGEEAGLPPPVACNLACVRGKHCVVTATGPSCVADDAEQEAGVSCGAVTCGASQICCSPTCGICGLRGGACPAIACLSDAGAPPTRCAATECPKDSYCDDISGTAECLPLPSCNTVKCTAATHCELVAVQCIRAPCPPRPQCVPNR